MEKKQNMKVFFDEILKDIALNVEDAFKNNN